MPGIQVDRCWRYPTAPRVVIAAILLLCLSLLSPAGVEAEEDGEKKDLFFYRITDVRRYFVWGWDFIPTGIDVTIGYELPPWFAGVDTILQATLGGGYEGFGTFRAFDYRPNTPLDPAETADPNGNLELNSPNFQWQAGIRQGILWNQELDRNLLEAFLYYRGRYDRYLDGRHYWGSDETQIAAI
ncbi:MAG: hypothetical protein V3T35_07900, partial [Spirochaetia bacterium]